MKVSRKGVSELYASVLMIGATLAFGGVVASAAVSQFNGATGGGSQGAAASAASAGKLVSLVYGTVVPGSGGCTAAYRGPDGGAYPEGKTYLLVLYDYGSVSFAPYEVFDNGTLLGVGGYVAVPAGSGAATAPATNSLTLPGCAHPTGQSFVLIDGAGDEVAVDT